MQNIFCSLQKASVERLKPFDDATILSHRLVEIQLSETIELTNNKRELLTDSAAAIAQSAVPLAIASIQSTSTTANNGGQY